jgi:hypothetical protein
MNRNGKEKQHRENCMICGAPLVYMDAAEMRECAVCHRVFPANASCQAGHFVCDECHSMGALSFLVPLLLESKEKSPQRLLEEVMSNPKVHMHGPEHHSIVPCVLLTAYHNCGGELELTRALREAVRRGKQVPGGSCGYLGACGAAVGAGIFASIALGSSPLSGENWALPQQLTGECLSLNAAVGGPRCCKRTSRTAISAGVRFAKEHLGVAMEDEFLPCVYPGHNTECLKNGCPFYTE